MEDRWVESVMGPDEEEEWPVYKLHERVGSVFAGNYGTVIEVKDLKDHYTVAYDGRGEHLVHAKHMAKLEGRSS